MAERQKLKVDRLPDYEPEVGAALWRLQDARGRTLRLLREVPPDMIDLEGEGNSIGTILYHLALIEVDWLFTEILEEAIPEEIERLLPHDDRDPEGVLTEIRGQSLEEHLGRLHTLRETFLERLRGITLEDFHRIRSLPDYDVSPEWVLHHLAQHEAEHRSELESLIGRLAAKKPAGSSNGTDAR